ncbi:MAG: HlyD family efflux transporter periplasmic adaptor subunit, partial [Clostridiales bacterium]|nr:HlyD family efflux transporter periplasmic adaptor subunit [Clostridiales bacterium]
SYDIYAEAGGQLSDVLISKGDTVAAGATVARFKPETPDESKETERAFRVERLNNQLASLELNRSEIMAQLQALDAAQDNGLQSYMNAVEDARLALSRTQTEYDAALVSAGAAFDDYEFQQDLDDALKDWNKRKEALGEAEAVLEEANAEEPEAFDDFPYQRQIDEAAVTLSRRKEALKEAEDALSKAKKDKPETFDDYTYQKNVDSANTVYDQSFADYNEALRQYDYEVQYYHYLIDSGADEASIQAATAAAESARLQINSAQRVLDDAAAAVDTAVKDLAKARSAFITSSEDALNKTVAELEWNVKQAKYAADDAKRAYDGAVSDRSRAKKKHDSDAAKAKETAVGNAEKNIVSAQAEVNDAALAYSRLVADRKRAADGAANDGREELASAGLRLADARTALERAEANLTTAREASAAERESQRASLQWGLQRIALDIERVNIDAREAESAEEAGGKTNTDIISGYGGIIVSVEKQQGQFVSQGEKIAAVGIVNSHFVCEITCPESEARFIAVGDEAILRAGGVAARLSATVEDIAREGDYLRIKLTCASEELSGGEYVTVNFNKTTADFDIIVPNEAVHPDGIGHCVWVIRGRRGALGVEYYSAKVKVIVADSDDRYAALSRGLDYYEPVVVSTSKELTVNGRVSRME